MRPQVHVFHLRSQFVTSSFWRNSQYSRLAASLFVTDALTIPQKGAAVLGVYHATLHHLKDSPGNSQALYVGWREICLRKTNPALPDIC